jgi:hypothetical protein
MRCKDDEIFEFIANNFSHNIHRIDFDYHFRIDQKQSHMFLTWKLMKILICNYLFQKIMKNVI